MLKGACCLDLGMASKFIQDYQMKGSSFHWGHPANCGPQFGRLNHQIGEYPPTICPGFHSGAGNPNPWHQVDLGIPHQITSIGLQKYDDGGGGVNYVRRFSVKYSNTSLLWFDYTDNLGSVKVYLIYQKT